MKKLTIKEEYRADSEEEAIQALKDYRDNQSAQGYMLGANGYKYKSRKSKGEIVSEAWIVTATKIYNEVWD